MTETNDKSAATLLIGPIKEILTPICNDNKPIRGQAMDTIKHIKNGGIAVNNDKIIAIGAYDDVKTQITTNANTQYIDASDNIAIPGFIDPHTHLVFAGNRASEFVERTLGKTYQQIAQAGGGILHTVKHTKEASLDKIVKLGLTRLKLMLEHGTTTCEVKTGYGLDLDCEIKLLEAILTLNKMQPIDLIPTFMPAHAIPQNKSEDEYTDEINNTMLEPAYKLIKEKYENNKPYFVDVFCDKGYFGKFNTIKILKKYKERGFQGKVHANEFENLSLVKEAIDNGAISCDHMLNTNNADIEALKHSNTICVLLPGTSFFLNLDSHANAKLMVDNSVAIALGSDYNPGSSHIFSIPFIFGLACLKLKMTPAQALTATTYNAACAISAQAYTGQIDTGYKADINILNVECIDEIPYNLTINPIKQVIKNGKLVYTKK